MTTTASGPTLRPPSEGRADLRRYLEADEAVRAGQEQVQVLEGSEAVEDFHRQLALLRRRLLADPSAFRELFLTDGMEAVAWEFRQPELGAEFVGALWSALLRGDQSSRVLMRFVWALPLRGKRTFVRALDRHLSDRYPMFAGLSQDWPAASSIPPRVREATTRSHDFDLVNTGFQGYLDVGYTSAEVDLFVWLEALRDKQCAEKPCELGVFLAGHREPQGGCPVGIHIPRVLELVGTGRFQEALELVESANPLPDVTGRVCPQELQCQGVCLHARMPIAIGQIEWFLPEREKRLDPQGFARRVAGRPDPWTAATLPPVAVVGSGPSGLINAYLLAVQGFPVTVFEAFHALGGVLRYGIPEFRLPNALIDDVVARITLLGGRFVPNFVVGRTASLEELREAGFWRVFVGTGAGLPKFLGVPGEHLLNVMSANEFLTRVNLMQALRDDHETPLPQVEGRRVVVVGGGNTAMDAARTARRLGGAVTIVYRRSREEMPARVEELEHALEEGVALQVLRSPTEFVGDPQSGFVRSATLDVMDLGEPDASGRRRPVPTGRTENVPVDLVIMALGNTTNPIIKDSEPRLHTSRHGTIDLDHRGSQETTLPGVFTGGDASRGGSTAVHAAGDGQAAAREIIGTVDLPADAVRAQVARARAYTDLAATVPAVVASTDVSEGIVELVVRAPLIARAARAGQFVRLLPHPRSELIPLTLADWDADEGTICLVVQGVGTTTIGLTRTAVGESFAGVAGPLGRPSEVTRVPEGSAVVLTAGGLGLPPVFPILREHLRLGNHTTLIAGFRSAGLMFWTGPQERIGSLQREYGELLDVICTTDDGSFGVPGLVTGPLEEMLRAGEDGSGRRVAQVVTIGPPPMMRAVSDLTRRHGVPCVASLNSIMVDATGMCGACMVPCVVDGRPVRRHACLDGPELDAHSVDWDRYLPRFGQFREQELSSRVRHGLA
ncbi:sulfide/dihydroorotate dehydrogenase-like FAD/NAD-binding protein [Actinotalea sp. K2]|uniref:sulfide/dihydroorotate dehydrogenase-like FAD/NAD-binding protein n=1 Tax=Actinotalea sp. K2 TaxID=2939438 RepID=UPI0020171944|nr:sulfide/dihydroorotate dehydrogenase-like FAD/NAD-binding protein [Actinotalea sp. K2]MCL3862368.1 sulfide/dihydroorotate dehydrogenase-like FAD/NAD-binding protein [Actinotalea sp. K2]